MAKSTAAKKPTFQSALRAISTWRLDEKRQSGPVYFVLAAIRGGDCPGTYTLKALITSRVRGIVFKAGQTKGNVRTSPFDASMLACLKAMGKKGTNGFAHFVSHLESAVKATYKHPIWGGYAGAIISELRRLG